MADVRGQDDRSHERHAALFPSVVPVVPVVSVVKGFNRASALHVRRRQALDQRYVAMNSDMSQHIERPRQINRVFLKETVKALCGLSAGERQAIVVLGIHEGSQHRMAEILREPVGTVKSRLSRGRAHLRNALGLDAAMALA